MSEHYAGRQIVGMDLHRRRSVLVRMTETGQHLETVRISNDPEYLAQVMARRRPVGHRLVEVDCGGSGSLPPGGVLLTVGALWSALLS